MVNEQIQIKIEFFVVIILLNKFDLVYTFCYSNRNFNL